jgi:hypothetical protein
MMQGPAPPPTEGLPHVQLAELQGHEGAVLAVRFNRQGTYCLSCGKVRRASPPAAPPPLPCPALPCPALPCPALPCPALPCPALLLPCSCRCGAPLAT